MIVLIGEGNGASREIAAEGDFSQRLHHSGNVATGRCILGRLTWHYSDANVVCRVFRAKIRFAMAPSMKLQRARANRHAWLALAGSFAIALTLSSVVAVLRAGDVGFLLEVFALDAISSSIFFLCSAGILLRHRTVSPRWVISTGAFLGVATYVAAWALWLGIAPSFRHAVPFELLPLALSVVFGLLSGATFYAASTSESGLTSR